MRYDPVKDHAERKRILSLIERCEKEQTMSDTISDSISRQAAIDEIEYELEMINSALDSITLDFNARERLRQRRGEAREILNSIQQLPSADRPQEEWIEVSTLREIFGDVQYAHRGNSEAEAVIADVWYEVKDVLKGADDEDN